MSESDGLNDRIVHKFKEASVDDEKKKFLLLMLGYELDRSNDVIWHYSQDYQREIEKSIKNNKG